ncbi:MAG TPA: prolyl oligopeptidase family serine peptidase [Bryobacteraceae bacterium]|nr:prolyl oligopeptidase family serine peptidase [Bryobacteraceae bacterium]
MPGWFLRSFRVVALFAALPVFGAAPFTIEQVLSAPFPDGLVTSPKGDAVAWVQNAAGVRNVWMARAPLYNAAQITKFTADDGEEISGLTWYPDGSHVLFTRGDGPNARGEFPNPRNDPAGKRQEVWSAGIAADPIKLGDGHSATVSPDGSMAVWILGGQVWSAALAGGEPKPAQLIHARGSASELLWSPAGGRFAFVSDRGDHAFVGVYKVAAKTLRFLDPSVDLDRSPVWSPDGKQVAFIRTPGKSGEFEFGPRRTGSPWSIRVADVETGRGREVWRAMEGRGSVYRQVAADAQLLWTTGDGLVFPWEGDGWLHLYSVDLKAGVKPMLLTPGDFEVENVAEAPDRAAIVFSSNQDDMERRHLWRVNVAGGAPRRLTSGTGIEWSPAALSDGRVAMFHSDAKAPARAALMESGGGIRDLAPATIPGDFPLASLIEPQAVTFPAKDGLRIHGQIFLPPAGGAAKHPAVVFFHGGPQRQMLPGWHYMRYYNLAYGFNQYLASRGYVVLSINYRSGIGYGSDFREALHFGATGASEFNDVLGAGAYLRGRPDVDAARIGVWGGSYGGYLAALALARASGTFAAGVDLHGVHDWNLEVTNTAPARDREKRQAAEKLAFESSPMASIATWKSPVLLIQGDDDRTVAFAQTVQLAQALRKQGVPFEQLIFPDEVHDFLVHADWLAAYHAADEFLGKYLKP